MVFFLSPPVDCVFFSQADGYFCNFQKDHGYFRNFRELRGYIWSFPFFKLHLLPLIELCKREKERRSDEKDDLKIN